MLDARQLQPEVGLAKTMDTGPDEIEDGRSHGP
jgi:hypothetical protein